MCQTNCTIAVKQGTRFLTLWLTQSLIVFEHVKMIRIPLTFFWYVIACVKRIDRIWHPVIFAPGILLALSRHDRWFPSNVRDWRKQVQERQVVRCVGKSGPLGRAFIDKLGSLAYLGVPMSSNSLDCAITVKMTCTQVCIQFLYPFLKHTETLTKKYYHALIFSWSSCNPKIYIKHVYWLKTRWKNNTLNHK